MNTRIRRRALMEALCLALSCPSVLVSEVQPDTAMVHWVHAGKELQTMLTGIAGSMTKGAFTPEVAETIHNEIWDLSASSESSPQAQVGRSYAYLVHASDEHQAVLLFAFLSTRNQMVDVTIVSDSTVMRLVRSSLSEQDLDSLYPFDRARLALTERRSEAAEPRLLLTLWTVREFSCPGTYIDHDLSLAGDTIHLSLHGVAPPPGRCPATREPARLARELRRVTRPATLVLSYRGKINRFLLDLTDTATAVVGLDSTLAQADERPRWRYPRNSFAFHCSEEKSAASVCSDVESWLGREPGITRLTIPPGWVNPYNPDPSGHSERRTTLFRYADVAIFERLRLCLSAVENRLRGTSGVSLLLEDWHAREISAKSSSARHERSRPVSEQVTRASACRTPRWLYQQ